MIVFALLFLVGLLSVQQLTELPNLALLITGAGVLSVPLWRWYKPGLFFIGGVVWAVVFASVRLHERLPLQLEDINIPVTGLVTSLPKSNEQRVSFDFEVQKSPAPLPAKIKLSWYFPPEQLIKAGEQWSFTVKLKRPHGQFNEGGFDYETWLFTEGIGATGAVQTSPRPELIGQESAWLSIAVIRQCITDRLSQLLKQSPTLAFIKALTLGDGNDITHEQWEVFRKTGTTHLIVISGSHIGLIAGLVYFLVLKCWAYTGILAWSPQKVAAIVAMIVACFYSALAGFAVPTQRALIMLAIAMFAIVQQRNTRSFTILATALFMILVFDPLAVLAVGFWLSFLSVCLIVYALAGRLHKSAYVFQVLKMNWVTAVGLSPLLLFFFQQVSLVSPLANFIAVPIISLLVVPVALVAVMLMFISPFVASKLFWLVDQVLQGLWWVLTELAKLPLATITHVQPSVLALFFAALGILIVLAPKGFPARWLGLVMFLPLIFTRTEKPAPGDLTLTMLDVGQGLSIVVQTANHWLVFDTGIKFSNDSDSAQQVLLPFLYLKDVSRLDGLIISHGDNDHIGGADSLLQAIPSDEILTSEPDKLKKYSPVQCRMGQTWLWDKVSFTILSPNQKFESGNENSCVLKIQSGQAAVLLAGDIESNAESSLIQNYGEQLKAQVLIAPHHGSKTSSSWDFLHLVKPEQVLISAGYHNKYGYPHAEVLDRYQGIKARIWSSAYDGEITARLQNQHWEISSLRQMQSKYWHFK